MGGQRPGPELPGQSRELLGWLGHRSSTAGDSVGAHRRARGQAAGRQRTQAPVATAFVLPTAGMARAATATGDSA